MPTTRSETLKRACQETVITLEDASNRLRVENTTDPRADKPNTAEPSSQKSPLKTVEIEAQGEKNSTRSNSVKSNRRARRLARAKEEVARLKLELAMAQLQTIETEDTDDEECVSFADTQSNRVAEWIEKQPPLSVNITAHHSQPEKPVQTTEITAPGQASHTALGYDLNIETNKAEPNHSKIDITDLAAAIALAARSGQPAPTPRYVGELTVFNGSHTEWLAFKAAYFETENYFTAVENTARLRRALTGKAKEAVSILLIANAQAQEIMAELETRFGRPDTIALAEIERLRSIQRPTDVPRDVCQFASKVKNSIATLQALNRVHYLYNPELVKHITDKLTPSQRYRWYDFTREQPSDEPDLQLLYRFVEREANTCGRFADPENIVADKVDASPLRRLHNRNLPQRAHSATDADNSTVRRPATCPVCAKTKHTAPSDCELFKDATSDERWDIAKKQKLCFRCLRYRSHTHRCKTNRCNRDGCVGTHHPLLHYDSLSTEKKETTEKRESDTVATAAAYRSKRSYLKILPVQLSGPDGCVDTYALLDDGSTVTLVDNEIATRVGANGPVIPLNIEAIAGAHISRSTSRRVTIRVKGKNEEQTIKARTMKDLKLSPQIIDDSDLKACSHLQDIMEQVRYKEAKPTLLIGQDNWELLLAHDYRRGAADQPVASHTSLGWVLHGSSTKGLGHHVHHVYKATETDDRLEEELKRHFSIESLGIQPKQTRADPNERALQLLRRYTTELPAGGYSTALLWKKDIVTLPNNYDAATKRLYSTEKTLDREPELKIKYEKQLNELLEKGYAEEVTKKPTEHKTWYLPHFPVIHPAKPNKVRPVFDAAARARGTSLNENLLSGPDLLQSLPGVLMRFRQYPIAVAADIQEMFLRIEIRNEDRDALRFLWRHHRREGSPIEYRMKVVIFGAACSPCTALFVKNYNAEKHRAQYPEAADAIVHHHYMDDYLQSFRTIEEARRITTDVQKIHTHANFHLRKWASNTKEILTECSTSEEGISLGDADKEEKILGIIWKPSSDTLGFNLNFARVSDEVISGRRTPTKREALRTVMSLFDPLGLVSPVTIQAKRLLQETWRIGTGWDEQLPTPLTEQWRAWLEQLRSLQNVNLPRCHPNFSDAVRRELHTFVDASESAYAAAVYWRIEDEDGNISVSLAAAKARVSPLKLTSIPRLELQAAVLGTRLAHTTAAEYEQKPDCRWYWSDSKTVLAWLRAGPRTFKPFVAHRVAEIEEETTANEWRWIPTQQNVADDATRTVPKDFNQTHRWFTGPKFLYDPPAMWPIEKKENSKNVESPEEERTHTARQANTYVLTEALPDVNRFSSWLRLIRTTARVLQAIDLLRCPTNRVNYRRTARNKEADPTWKSAVNRRRPSPLLPLPAAVSDKKKSQIRPLEDAHVLRAETLWVRASQQNAFPVDIMAIKNGESLSRDSRLRQIAVCLDSSDTIVLKSRISAATDVAEEQKNPAILDGDQPYTRLYIDWVHRKLHHGGVEIVLNEIRQRFWILRARPPTRSVIKRCQSCRVRRAIASIPPTGDHPISRLAHHQRPFTYTGLDYFGPLSVTVGRQHQKRYVALFTCLTTRAVHLELAASLSTDSAILALRRMMARRGRPTEIWSDNGTNLHGADVELQRAALEASREEAVNHRVRWRFIPPGAPFMGGAWERLVRSVKTALAAVLNAIHPQEEVLATLLCEAEYTVNSRPLTHVSVELEDDEALTPNHFLLGGSGQLQAPGNFNETDICSKHHWRRAQRLADLFWTRWMREYLPELQCRREPYGKGEPLQTGDLVLVADSNLPRNAWPRGRVTRVYPGRDGIVRAADVQLKNGVLRRPTKRLIVIPTKPTQPEPIVVSRKEDAAPSSGAARRENVHDGINPAVG